VAHACGRDNRAAEGDDVRFGKEKGNYYFFFSLMKRSKNHPTTELAKNLMYSLNLPIQPQPVEDF
jgi:hypothetical protein